VNFDALKDFLSEDEAAPAAGEQLGRYRLVREIARGGTAVVFEAHDPELQRQVAIKILRAGNLERLRHEAAIAARLRHPNIVAVHEVGPSCRWTRACARSRPSPAPSTTPTGRAWCIAISSPPT